MIAPAQIVYLVFVIILTVVGVATIGANLLQGGQLHIANAIVGGGSLLLAVALAIPLKLKDALTLIAPYLDQLRGIKRDG